MYRSVVKIVLILSLPIFLISCHRVSAQENKETMVLDTIACVQLPPVYIYPTQYQYSKKKKIPRRYRKGTRAYNRTIRNLKVVYPYAKQAAIKVAEVEAKMKLITDEKERKAYVKREYKALLKTYKKPLMRLRISQGKMLVKLIDRETQNTSFEHLKHYKGGFVAFFWQSFARLFTINLKDGYDKYGEDRYLEELILKYEKGEL